MRKKQSGKDLRKSGRERQKKYRQELLDQGFKFISVPISPEAQSIVNAERKRTGETVAAVIERALKSVTSDVTINAEKLILEHVRGIPGAMSDKLITFPELRAELNISKEDFDAAILSLIRADILIPHRHVHPSRMDAQEREEMVTDGDSWFCGFTLNIE